MHKSSFVLKFLILVYSTKISKFLTAQYAAHFYTVYPAEYLSLAVKIGVKTVWHSWTIWQIRKATVALRQSSPWPWQWQVTFVDREYKSSIPCITDVLRRPLNEDRTRLYACVSQKQNLYEISVPYENLFFFLLMKPIRPKMHRAVTIFISKNWFSNRNRWWWCRENYLFIW